MSQLIFLQRSARLAGSGPGPLRRTGSLSAIVILVATFFITFESRVDAAPVMPNASNTGVPVGT